MPIVNRQTKVQTYKGFSTVGRPYGNWRLTDLDLIKQDIINHFYINKGEKLENSNFGCIIPSLQFEQLDDQTKDAIISGVNEILDNDKRVTVENVNVIGFKNGIQIDIVLTYNQFDLTESLSLKFDKP